jgi:uncharacterized protein YlzI (FlbEa/FlbD family)
MIRVIRKADGMEILLNTTMIVNVEHQGDTVITLVNGEKIAIKSPVGDVIEKMRAYHMGITEENQAFEELSRQDPKPKDKDKDKDKDKNPPPQPEPNEL